MAAGMSSSRTSVASSASAIGDAEAHLLEGDELTRGEAGEDDDDDRRGAGDQPGGGRDAVDDRAGVSPVAAQRSWMRLSRNTW